MNPRIGLRLFARRPPINGFCGGLACLLLAVFSLLPGQQVTWLRRLHGAYGQGICYAPNLDLLVTGSVNDSPGFDLAVQRYSTDGDSLSTLVTGAGRWACGYRAIADKAGSVYAAGTCYNESTSSMCLLVKFASGGETLWLRKERVADEDIFSDVALDRSGNVIVVGSSYSYQGGGTTTGLMRSYDSTGGLNWAKTMTWSGDIWGVVAAGGEIYACGTDSLGRMLLLKCDSVGDTVWTVRSSWGGLPFCTGWGLALDSAGSVAVAVAAGDGVYYKIGVITCDTTGRTLWERSFQPGSDDWAAGIAADSAGNFFVSGVRSNNDYWLAKLGPAGETLWTTTCNSGGSDLGYGVTVVGSDPVMTGTSTGSEGTDAITIRFSGATGIAEPNRDASSGDVDLAVVGCPGRNLLVAEVRLRQSVFISLRVCDPSGRAVAVLATGLLSAGRHEFTFDARAAPAGVYFLRLDWPSHSETRKLVLTK